MITVFTPTYNRGYIIKNLYDSLCQQTIKDFEWIIVDDGSDDNTSEIVSQWINSEKRFPIIYKQSVHGGKHRAINIGVHLAKGELFFIVDSDDILVNDAIEWLQSKLYEIEADERLAGVSGLRGTIKTKQALVGSYIPNGEYETLTLYEIIKKASDQNMRIADYSEAYLTKVMIRYPFPEFIGEDFISENAIWYKIANDGLKLRWYNKVIYLCEYLNDGLTRNMQRVLRRNPVGWGYCLGVELDRSDMNSVTIFKCLRYYAFVKKKYTDTEIKDLLHTDSDTMKQIIYRYEYILGAIKEYLQEQKIHSIAVYGIGGVGYFVLEILEEIGVSPKFAIDEKAESTDRIRIYRKEDNLPAVDSICIALQNYDDALRKKIEKLLPDTNIWCIKEFMQ